MNMFSWLLGHKELKSGEIAKNRLQLVLVQDRVKLSPENMDKLKDELIQLISRYVEIDREGIDISLTKAGRQSRLTANIPVIGMRQE